MASAEPLTDWPNVPDGVIPASIETTGPPGMVVRGYPALVVTSDLISCRKGRCSQHIRFPCSAHSRIRAQTSGAGKQVQFSVLTGHH